MQLIYLCLPTMMLTTVLALPTGNKVDSMDKRQGPGSLYGIYNAYNMYGNVDGTTASDDTYGKASSHGGCCRVLTHLLRLIHWLRRE